MPLWLNIRSTGADVAGTEKTFSSSGCSICTVASAGATENTGVENAGVGSYGKPNRYYTVRQPPSEQKVILVHYKTYAICSIVATLN